MNKILEKWKPVMDALSVSDGDKKLKMSEYAEHFIASKLEDHNIFSISRF